MKESKVYYTYKGTQYEIISDDVPPLQLLSDFKHLESIGDWNSIDNRIINGKTFNWLIKVK